MLIPHEHTFHHIAVMESKKVFLMGGGIGIPPMLELARELPASTEKQIIVGYRDDQLFLKEDLEKNGTVYIATEDGSVGTKGNVMNAIEENHLQADVIFACGPMPMLRAIKNTRKKRRSRHISPWKSIWPAAWVPAWAVL